MAVMSMHVSLSARNDETHLGGRQGAPRDATDAYFYIAHTQAERQTFQPPPVDAQIDERAQNHVTTDPGERIENCYLHNHPRRPNLSDTATLRQC